MPQAGGLAIRRVIFSPKIFKQRSWWAPLLLVAIGFFLRAAYYHENYGHPDETITFEVVNAMRRTGDLDTNWAKANLEPGLRYDQYNFSSHLYATYFFYRCVKLIPGLADWRSLNDGFWVYRFFSVLLATVAVWQTWRLARRVGGELAAWMAAIPMVFSLLMIQDAHYLRAESFVTVLTLAAVSLCLPTRRQLRFAEIFGAAVLVGVLVACKISMLALIWLPLVSVAATFGDGPPGKFGARAAWAGLATLGGASLGFCLGAPGAVLHPAAFWNGVERLTHQYAGLHPPYSHSAGGPVADMMAGYFRSTLGWPTVLAGLGGAAILLVRRKWAEWLVLAGPVVLFAGYFATRSVFFERNLSHVLPLFFVLAGIGAAALIEGVGRYRPQAVTWVAIGLGLAMVARPAELTRRLLWIEFSQRGAVQHEAFEADIKARFPGAAWWAEALMNSEPIERMAAHFKAGGAPILLCQINYHDEWTAHMSSIFRERFEAELIAVDPSKFADVPGCTLHTYNSWTCSYYLVRGLRPGAAH